MIRAATAPLQVATRRELRSAGNSAAWQATGWRLLPARLDLRYLSGGVVYRRMTPAATIRHYALSCGLLLIPASVWNIALASRLPASFAPAEFWRDIPAPLALTENGLRLAVFVLPFLMPLDLEAPGRIRASFIFAAGTFLYFVSWLALILFPSSTWSASALGFTAPAYTPAVWLFGIAQFGRRLFWGRFYRWWMYAMLAVAFLAAHVSHTALVFARTHK